MNVRKCFVLMAVSLMILCGCDNGKRDLSYEDAEPTVGGAEAVVDVAGGGVITLEKKSAHRSCVLKIGGEDRTVSFTTLIFFCQILA